MSPPALTVYQDGLGAVTADGLNTFAQWTTTALTLRNFTGLSNMIVVVLGTTAVGDGGTGLFYWASESTATDDGINVIVPSGQYPGAWLRLPPFVLSGISGGIPYFSTADSLASSATLAANALVVGGGVGGAPSTVATGAGILNFIGAPSSATLAAAVSDTTGTGALVFKNSPTLTSPTLTTPAIVGITNGTSSATGDVGELVQSNASLVSLTSGTPKQITSVTLSAGNWTLWGTGIATAATSTVTTSFAAIISQTSNSITTAIQGGQIFTSTIASTSGYIAMPVGQIYISITVPTTYYLNMNVTFTTSTLTGSGYLKALRVS